MRAKSIKNADDGYEMNRKDIAEKMFLDERTIGRIERKAIDSFKEIFAAKGLKASDLLNF